MHPVTVCLGGRCHRREFWKSEGLLENLETSSKGIKGKHHQNRNRYEARASHEPRCEPKIFFREICIRKSLGLLPLGILRNFIPWPLKVSRGHSICFAEWDISRNFKNQCVFLLFHLAWWTRIFKMWLSHKPGSRPIYTWQVK